MNESNERGQAAAMTILFLTVLIGVTALALDVGSWYHAKRQLQAAADAAALAGAQALPESTDDAKALATEYALDKNNAVVDPDGIQIDFSNGVTPHDTINVRLSGPADGFFSKLFGIDKVTVGAHASARSDNVSAALRVAPIVVNYKHPKLQCSPLPCPGDTEIDLADLHNPGSGDAAGAFGLIDLLQNDNGSVGASTLGEWINKGFDEFMKPGDYNSVPSSKFNSVEVRSAMTASIGQVLLFPIYDTIAGPGSNAVYHVIGWVGFHVTGFDATGSTGKVTGWFTRRVSEGIQVTPGDNVPDYGVRAVQLIN